MSAMITSTHTDAPARPAIAVLNETRRLRLDAWNAMRMFEGMEKRALDAGETERAEDIGKSTKRERTRWCLLDDVVMYMTGHRERLY